MFDIYCNQHPRSLALLPSFNATHDVALEIKHSREHDTRSTVFCSATLSQASVFRRKSLPQFISPLNAKPIVGIIGLIELSNGTIFICT
jgi:hypothetical protein